MNYTANYQLPQWVETDRILMDDFNDSYSKLDAALDGLRGDVDANDAAQTAALAAKGNCKICYQTYVGTGTCSNTAPNQLTFAGRPLLLVVASGTIDYRSMVTLYGAPAANTNIFGDNTVTLTWAGNTVQWYHYSNPQIQLNTLGVTYYVAALLDMSEQ